MKRLADRRMNPFEIAELERQAGRLLPTDRDRYEFLKEQRESAMREHEFVERSGKDRRQAIRTEFGELRTSCSCETCAKFCRFLPGFLIPSDLDRMIPAGADPYQWAEKNLLASPGAVVGNMETGERFEIHTLVPAIKSDGSCIHLTPEGRCGIHPVAPFGCAFFDCGPEPAGLLMKSMKRIQDAFKEHGLYRNLWAHLAYMKKTQRPPAELREKMAKGA